jgi:DNA helicase II / ATP-dependent DNA helicase PcrA
MRPSQTVFDPIWSPAVVHAVPRRAYGDAMLGDILAAVNDEQRRAVMQVRGPVCILAGAGSGKTTTITRRIAYQVATETLRPSQILAVTFTEKAAREMKGRLQRLGVEGVRASTFHSAALAQLRVLSREAPGEILASKVPALRRIANTLPKPYRFRPAIDLATEIEWARNRRVSADDYVDRLGDHEPPIPVDLMASVFRRYEKSKRDAGLIDFEDLLELAIRMYEIGEVAVDRFRAKYAALTVDEYQDVNLLQETLLRLWIGGRDDLCVVGDDYQSIYGFTGATPAYLLDMPSRFPGTRVIRLEHNYRSTPQILDAANRLALKLGGANKTLRPTRDPGTAISGRSFSTDRSEIAWIVARIEELHDGGIPFEEMAILYRVNFRSEDYEASLAEAAIPFQVRDTAFLARAAARHVLNALARRARSTSPAKDVRAIAEKAGYIEEQPGDLGEQEMTRQDDLARLIRLAEEFDDGARSSEQFVDDLRARFTTEGEGRGVNLLTYHRAKGLEFEAVFLPRLEDGELPFKRSSSPEAYAEERRLLYVGITRAKSHLALSWVMEGRRRPSPFVHELGLGAGARSSTQRVSPPRPEEIGEDELHRQKALKRWRLERAKRDSMPAYVILHDATLTAIAARDPQDESQLGRIPGIGPAKLDKYGEDILEVLSDARRKEVMEAAMQEGTR